MENKSFTTGGQEIDNDLFEGDEETKTKDS